MGRDIPLGRIAGIRVGMSVAVPLMAVIYTYVLATTSFRAEVPGLHDGWYWGAGVFGAMLFFVSLLAHEIGHALVARDEGIGVHSMALTPLGGVTRMESSATSAGSEFRVSVVGPIASSTCGVLFLAISFLLPEGDVAGLAGSVFAWAGWVNLALAVFNLIPASPLDGGKVLSSAIWWRTGSQAKAVTWSSWAGVGVGSLLVWVAYRGWHPPNVEPRSFQVGVAVVGGFILYSAIQELRSAPLLTALQGVTVGDAMVVGAPTAPAWLTVEAFLATTAPSAEHQAYPVVDTHGTVTGLLSASAVRSVPPEVWRELTVAGLAFPLDRVVLVSSDDPLLPALQRVEAGDLRDGLVVGPEGTIVGTLDDRALHRVMTRHRAGLSPSAA